MVSTWEVARRGEDGGGALARQLTLTLTLTQDEGGTHARQLTLTLNIVSTLEVERWEKMVGAVTWLGLG